MPFFKSKHSRYTVAIFLIAFALKLEASPIPSSENCEFYKFFREPRECKDYEKSYTRTYGLYYCQAFLEKRTEWRGSLVEWTKSTSLCLQEMLANNVSRVEPSCDQLLEFAFDSHPICYKWAGICKLSNAEKWKVVSVVRIIDISDNKRNSVSQLMNVVAKCMDYLWTENVDKFVNRLFFSTRNFSVSERKEASELLRIMPQDRRESDEYVVHVFPSLLFSKDFDGMEMAVEKYNSHLDFENIKTLDPNYQQKSFALTPFLFGEGYLAKAESPNEPEWIEAANAHYTKTSSIIQIRKALGEARKFASKRK